ncbi:MAG: helix-turn-helix domain-containing protein [Bacteroidia bacterium]
MLLIPNRLLTEDFVCLFHHDLHCTFLKKKLDCDLHGRQSYVVRHAVSIVLKGTQHITGEQGFSVSIKAGELGFIPKGLYTVTDLVSDEGAFESYHLYLDTEYFDKLKEEMKLGEPAKTTPNAIPVPPLLPAFMASLDAMYDGKYQAPFLFDAKVREFVGILLAHKGEAWLASLFRMYQKPPKANLQAFMQAYFDKPFSIADYAFLTGRSISSFNREFRSKFDTSPRQWLIKHRLGKAKDLLTEQRFPVSEVADRVGFNSVSHFIKSFKEAYGRTPGEMFDSKPIL